ncbi:MAG: acetolactate synthase [Planctomycetota bacterium]
MVTVKRGRDDPGLRQLSLFLHNKVGELADMLRHLEAETVRVHAISIMDSVDHAVVRLVVDKTDKARQLFIESGTPLAEGLVLGVRLPDTRSGLLELSRALIGAEINIHYIYSMMARPGGGSAVVVHVDDMATAVEAITQRGFDLVFESDLQPGLEDPGPRF